MWARVTCESVKRMEKNFHTLFLVNSAPEKVHLQSTNAMAFQQLPQLSADNWRNIALSASSWPDVLAIGGISKSTLPLRRDAALAAELFVRQTLANTSSKTGTLELAAISLDMSVEDMKTFVLHGRRLLVTAAAAAASAASAAETASAASAASAETATAAAAAETAAAAAETASATTLDEPLFVAAGRASAAVVRWLASDLPAPRLEEGLARHALLEASSKGRAEVVEVLLEHLGGLDQPSEFDRWTAAELEESDPSDDEEGAEETPNARVLRWASRIFDASFYGRYDENDDPCKIDGLTALMVATANGHRNVASMLLANGASSVDARVAFDEDEDKQTFSAVDVAVFRGDEQLCGMFVDAGASRSTLMSALKWAVVREPWTSEGWHKPGILRLVQAVFAGGGVADAVHLLVKHGRSRVIADVLGAAGDRTERARFANADQRNVKVDPLEMEATDYSLLRGDSTVRG